MLKIIMCMCIDPIFCILTIAEFLSWIGLMISIIYFIKKII
ncbi:MAG: hypothetical protein SO178_05480 [Floccifex porci]|nr:hypothetical protein [Floccifex porci]MDD7467075.1 hypothetical protein [Floccifex porci]MDO4479818.1 hypothetical protein [Erysipelotrichaceae bacterium]MDY4797102.1 hypothetical protein [Floccifex porci]